MKFETQQAIAEASSWKQYNPEFNREKAWPKTKYPFASLEYLKDGGCFVFSIAIALRIRGFWTSPLDALEKMKRAGLFTLGADLIYWKIDKALPLKALWTRDYSPSLLRESLENGLVCIAEVPGTNHPHHYVAVYQAVDDDFLVIDSNSDITHLSVFGNIYKVVAFQLIE